MFWVLHVIFCIISWKLSGLSCKEWHLVVGLYGVRKLSKTMTRLSRSKEDPNTRKKWEDVFDVWWGFSIKYICPFALWFLLSFSIAQDLKTNYGGYHRFWQSIGLLFPFSGIAIFLYSLTFCKQKDPFNPLVDKAFED